MRFKENIAIVGAGCVLPGARNTSDFWKILCEGRHQFRSLPGNRWNKDIYFDPEKNQGDSSYSDLAAYVADDLFFDSNSDLPRGHQMMLTALREAVAPFDRDQFRKRRVAVVLGCMNPEDEASVSLVKAQKNSLMEEMSRRASQLSFETESFLKEFDKCFQDTTESLDIHFPSSLAYHVHRELGTKGLSFCADSACGSSLTAIDLACLLLESGEVDLVVTGGVEANLGIETYVPFSRLGVLARTRSLPYDAKSEGIIQGEGSVLFVLERLSDAQDAERDIWGLIEGITSSSNGAKASLFSPSQESQKVNFSALEATLVGRHPIYIEGHGTGTLVGDRAELEALKEVFSPIPTKVLLGSVKAIIGHTKGTAGAAGLLKCLLSLRHSFIPPSTYFENACSESGMGNLEINLSGVELGKNDVPLQMRVCSAGFGGANYYLALSEHKKSNHPHLEKGTIISSEASVLVAFSQVPFFAQTSENKYQDWKIPPHLANHLDFAQISALTAVELALEKSLISKKMVQKLKTCVISASHTRTNKMEKISHVLQLKKVENPEYSFQEILRKYRNELVKLDQTTCQALNSMISGRVANAFDLAGTNFHIDADFSSLGYSLKMGQQMINQKRAEMVILLGIEEIPGDVPYLISRQSVSCWVLTSPQTAEELSLPQLGSVSEVLVCHEG